LEFVRFRIAVPNILWPVRKTLTAGAVEDGRRQPTSKGTEQGNLSSPVIANIYMNYTLALWHEVKLKGTLRGESGLVICLPTIALFWQLQIISANFKTLLA
jgi:retron-type reverse transcriptase